MRCLLGGGDLLDGAAAVGAPLCLDLLLVLVGQLAGDRLGGVEGRLGSSMVTLLGCYMLLGTLAIELRCGYLIMVVEEHGLIKLHVLKVLHLLLDRLGGLLGAEGSV